jgi:hypothetical protein
MKIQLQKSPAQRQLHACIYQTIQHIENSLEAEDPKDIKANWSTGIITHRGNVIARVNPNTLNITFNEATTKAAWPQYQMGTLQDMI